jgi:uncharacterized protein YwgA
METYTPPEMDMLGLARENNRLLKENNELLKKIDRRDIRGMWFKIIWIAVIIGLPLIFLSYFMNNYMSMLGVPVGSSDTTSILESLQEAQKTLDELRVQ